MFRNLDRWGPATVLIVLVSLIVVVVGGIAVLTDTYDDDVRLWIDDLRALAYGIAGLGLARAVKLGADRVADARLGESSAYRIDDADLDREAWAAEDAAAHDPSHAAGNPGEDPEVGHRGD